MTGRLLLGTRNTGKVAELRAILKGLDLELLAVDELADPPPDPPEDAATYAENAIFKARSYARATGLTTIADDSGLEVDALGGAPGVRSRRFFGDVPEPERNRMLLALLDGVTDRAARFVAVIALAQPDGQVETFDGEVRGEIATAPRGEGRGFGYDPVFVIAGDGRTMAQLPAEEKNAISHRGLAGAKLRAALGSG